MPSQTNLNFRSNLKRLAERPGSTLLSREAHARERRALVLGVLLGAAFLTVGPPAWAGDATPAPSPASETEIDPKLSLKGKTIGITVIGTDHYWDLRSYQAQIDEVKRLGGTPIALDAGRDDNRQISQIQTLIAQKPDAIIEQLGTLSVLEPWLQKIRKAGIPLFTTDTASPSSINDTTSDNFYIGEQLAVQLANDIHGEGNILVFNGFYGVPVCAIRYDELKEVLKFYPKIKIIQPELRDVIPNTVQSAYAQVTEMLTKYPKGQIAAIWSAAEGCARQVAESSLLPLYTGRTDGWR
jgi:ribose transport system substrate-binding protein